MKIRLLFSLTLIMYAFLTYSCEKEEKPSLAKTNWEYTWTSTENGIQVTRNIIFRFYTETTGVQAVDSYYVVHFNYVYDHPNVFITNANVSIDQRNGTIVGDKLVFTSGGYTITYNRID